MPLSFRLTISSLETVLTLLSKCIQRSAAVTTSYHASPKRHYLWPRWQQQPSAWSPSFSPHPVHFEPSSHHDYFDTQVWSGHFTANTLLFTISSSAQHDLVPGHSLTFSFATPLLLHCRPLAFAFPWHLNHTSDTGLLLYVPFDWEVVNPDICTSLTSKFLLKSHHSRRPTQTS